MNKEEYMDINWDVIEFYFENDFSIYKESWYVPSVQSPTYISKAEYDTHKELRETGVWKAIND